MTTKGRQPPVEIWRRAMAQWTDEEREAYEHLAATYQYDAADVYPTRALAEKAAFDAVSETRKVARSG